MKRILVIGSAGAEKSVFAKRLSAKKMRVVKILQLQ